MALSLGEGRWVVVQSLDGDSCEGRSPLGESPGEPPGRWGGCRHNGEGEE